MTLLGSWIQHIISWLFPNEVSTAETDSPSSSSILEPEKPQEQDEEEPDKPQKQDEEEPEKPQKQDEEEPEKPQEEEQEPEEPLDKLDKVFFKKENPKKGLLIGINYNNDDYKNDDLNGCENDMNRLGQWIKDNCFFSDDDITKLDSKTATRENMENEIKKMVNFANTHENSELWFSYSGHGSHYFSVFEKDKQDEIICPSDYSTAGYITDNWLKKEFLDKLPSDCKMFVIMDCCHSGSNMDLPFCLENGVIQTRNNITENIQAKVVKLSGCLDSQVSMDYYNSKMGEFQGAFTNAFAKSYQKDIILNNCDNLNIFLKLNGFKQVSELAMSEPSLWAWEIC